MAARRTVETRPCRARPGDLRPARLATGRAGGVEPLGEEVAQPGHARGTAVREPRAEARLQLPLRDRRAPVPALDLLKCLGEVGLAGDLPQRDVGASRAGIRGVPAEQAERRRIGWRRRPEAALARVVRVELLDEALAERPLASRREWASRGVLRVACSKEILTEGGEAFLEKCQIIAGLRDIVPAIDAYSRG
jgi:hypothetical protein